MRVENTTTHVIQYLISTNEVMGPGTDKIEGDAITDVASKVTCASILPQHVWWHRQTQGRPRS